MGFLDKLMGRAKETAEKAAPHVEKAKDAAGDLAEKAAPHVEKAKDAAKGAYESVDEKAGGRVGAAAETGGTAPDASAGDAPSSA